MGRTIADMEVKYIQAGYWAMVLVLTFQCSLNGCLCAATKPEKRNSYPAASFIFGDSLVDAGNNNYIGSLARANYGANGVDFPGGKATGRFCNGRTVADIIDQLLGIPFVPVFLDPAANGKAILKGVNYASGGAGILDFTGYTFVNRIPMWEQINMFRNTTEQILQMLGTPAGEELIQNAIYSITMGSNDYLNNYLIEGSPSPMLFTPQQFQDTLISTYRQQLTALVKLGARKFVLTNVGPLGCIPYRMTMQATEKGRCVKEDNELVSGFNAALKWLVDELNDKHGPKAKFLVADSYNVFMQIIKNPSAFGFATKDQACCGMPIGLYHGLTPCFPGVPFCKNRKSHLFWDPFHPTDAANVILGHRFYSGPSADVYPINVKQLAALQLPS